MKLCPVPGCRVVVKTGRCTQHQREPRKKRTRSGVDRELRRDLDTQAWRKLSRSHLQQNPFCHQCAREGRDAVLATQVDHMVSRRKDRRRVLDSSNLESLCDVCHQRKTARGD